LLFKIDFDGTGIAWADSYGDGNNQSVSDVKLTDNGDVIVAGDFVGGMAFDRFLLSSVGFRDSFVTRISSNGNVLWAREEGTSRGYIYGPQIAIEPKPDGYIYLGAVTGGPAGMGPDLGNGPLRWRGNTDALFARFLP
jgi:hypothetical protein